MLGEERMMMEDQIQEIRENMQKRFPEIDWPEPVMEPVFRGRLRKTKVLDRKAIFDAKTGITWDIVSDSYALISHEEALWNLLSAVPKEFGEPVVTADIWQDGARFRANARFPEVAKQKFEVKVGDVIQPRISTYSSYDRSTHHGIIAGAEQLACSNGAVAFVENSRKKRKHLKFSSVSPEELTEQIHVFLTEFSKQADVWRGWAERQLGQQEFTDIMEALPFSEPEREKILELPLMNDADGRFLKQFDNPTLWDVHSAATQFARHEVRGVQRSIDLEEQIAAVLYEV